MKYMELGNTGIIVSKLCFGGLIIGPLQADLPVCQGGDIIVKAMELGVNFIDTAELYGTYAHIKEAIKRAGKKPVIAAKSYTYDRAGAIASIEKARKEMDIDVIDIFLMHEQESRLTLRGHREAFEYYIEAREKGLVKAVGVSTHNIEVVDACAEMDGVDVIHPLVNKKGIGIGDGTVDQMLYAVEKAYQKGKGIYGMKPLGGGNLIKDYNDSMDFVLGLPCLHSIAVGMQSVEEVIMNVAVFNGDPVPKEILEKLKKQRRKLHIDSWCQGCGQCVTRCKQGALKVVNKRVEVDEAKCVLCSYCSGVCPDFAIKVQ